MEANLNPKYEEGYEFKRPKTGNIYRVLWSYFDNSGFVMYVIERRNELGVYEKSYHSFFEKMIDDSESLSHLKP